MKTPSLQASVVLLAILCVVAAQAVSLTVLLVFPTDPPPPLTPAAAAAAFLAPDRAVATGLRVRETAAAPFAVDRKPYTRLVAHSLALLLARAGVHEIRVRSLSDAVSIHTDGAPPSAAALVPTKARSDPRSLANAPFPSFAAAVRRRDGRWRVVEPVTPALSLSRLRILVAFGLSLIILTPLTWWCARRLSRPLRVLALASRRLEHDPGAPPLAVAGPREVQAAAMAFNAMQAGLAQHMDERAALMGAIAHDLRTPLTSLRLRAEAAPPSARARMADDIDRMERLVADLLTYVRGGRPTATRTRFDLADLAEEVARDARARGSDVALGSCIPTPVLADSATIRRVLENLVNNACAYAGDARITLHHDGAEAWVDVEDEGPGLSPDALEAVFQPFVRFDVSRSRDTGGAGLGLAIARNLARANGGEVALCVRKPCGLRARLSLPLCRAS